MSVVNEIVLEQKPVAAGRRNIQISQIMPFLGLIIVVMFFEIVSGGRLLTINNSKVLLNEVFSIGLGAAVVFLMSQGNMDFSLGAVVGLAAALAAIASGISPAFLFPAAILAGLLLGSINGFIYAKLKIPAFIATLAMSFVIKGMTSVLLNGSRGIPFKMNKFDNPILKMVVFFGILIICYIVFEYTSYGKQSRAAGSLPEAARQSGVNLFKVRLISFIISGGVCGLVAFFSLVRSCTASNTTGSGFEFNVLLALMIGGLSLTGGWPVKFRSVVIGSITMAIISNGMTLWGIDGFTQQLVKGLIFIVAVMISFDRKNVSVIK
jgi:ribose transport system permease protein